MFPGYRTASHHELIARHIEAIERGTLDRLIVTMPPRHGKSVIVSEHFPAWFLGRNPDKRVIACSHTQSLADTFSRRARNKLTDPHWPFPNVTVAGDLRNVRSWDIDGHRGGYVAAGVGGPITGHGADVLAIDDPVKSAEEADSEAFRDRAWEWFQGTALTRLQPGGAVVVVGTRWHEDDLIGRLIAGDTGWTVLHLPAVSDEGDALWPDWYDTEALERIKREIGPRAWEALYQGRPSPAQGGTFKRHWWQRYHSLPHLKRVEIFVDSAFKDGVGNDFSVFAVWGDDGLGSYYVIDVWREKVQFPDLIRAGHDVSAKHRDQAIIVPLVVEDKASGQSAIQVWSRPLPTLSGMTLPALPVIPFPVVAGESKTARAEGVSPLVAAGRVFLPESADWVDDFIEEHAGFPTAKHDDMVDTTSMALARLAGPQDVSWSDIDTTDLAGFLRQAGVG
jgi:predicted phage terminase large subunit-like protein